MRRPFLLNFGIRCLFIFVCLFFINSQVFAQTQRYVQIDVKIVEGKPTGEDKIKLDGKQIKAWDSATFLNDALVPPDPTICVETNGQMQCAKGNCPDLYFCTFIGVPITSNTFKLEVWDEDFAENDLVGKGSVSVNSSLKLGQAEVKVTEIPCPDKEIQVTFEHGIKIGGKNQNIGHHQFERGFVRYPVFLGSGSKVTPPDYHYYVTISREMCKTTTPGCDLKMVFETMISKVAYVAPSTDAKPVVHCKENQLVALTGEIGGSNPVKTTVDSKNFTIVNYTLAPHIFYPGKISRKVIKNGNAVFVTTVGEGFGQYPDLNKNSGVFIFEGIDGILKQAVTDKLQGKK